MELFKSGKFLLDVEEQALWYSINANSEVAEAYLRSIESTCDLLCRHPLLGPTGRFKHAQLATWRFFILARPFQKHILFYQVRDTSVIMRRAMHGSRDLEVRIPPDADNNE